MIFWIFLFLMIMHMIADFGTPYRQWGVNWKWFGKNPPDWKNVRILFKRFFFSEYFLSMNPLHSIWDEWSPLRRHPRYMVGMEVASNKLDIHEHFLAYASNTYDDMPTTLSEMNLFHIDGRFWRYLAVDQLFHVLSNAFLAWIVVSLL